MVTSVDVPFYVTVEGWPPKAVKEGAACGVEALVAKAVVGIVDQRKVEWQHDAQLVLSVGLPPPKAAIG